jgi:hypothetical protein
MAAFESDHRKAVFQSPSEELKSTLERTTPEQAEAATSSHLVRMIDFIFALVLGQGLIRFSSVVEEPFEANVQVWIALVLIYYTVVRSFVAWHTAIETRRYRMLSDRRTTELWRVYIDVLIVATYAYMLFSAEPLMRDGGGDVTGLLWAFPFLFLLYQAWGGFRLTAWGEDEFRLGVLQIFAALYVVLALAYTLIPSDTWSISDKIGNTIALAIALGLMGLYRYINFWQGDQDRNRIFWKIPRPRIPPLKRPADASLQSETSRK